MTNYRRSYKGLTYFFTVVTHWPWFTIHKYHRLWQYRNFDWRVIENLAMDPEIEYDID